MKLGQQIRRLDDGNQPDMFFFFFFFKMERRGTTAAVRQTRCFEAVLFAGAMVGCMYVMGMLGVVLR